MIWKFNDVEKAVAHLSGTLREKAAAPWVEVVWYFSKGARMRRTRVAWDRLVPLLEHTTRRFPGATVAFQEGEEGIPSAGGIQCRCRSSAREICPDQCHHLEERPLVCIVPCTHEMLPPDSLVDLIRSRFLQEIRAFRDKGKRVFETPAQHEFTNRLREEHQPRFYLNGLNEFSSVSHPSTHEK